MKLRDIAGKQLNTKLSGVNPCFQNYEMIKAEELMWPEIEELQKADVSGLVASCIYLEEDERELANRILNKLSDTGYQPSPIIYQAIRAINARIQISLDRWDQSR